MPAYMKDLNRECQQTGCTKLAMCAVYNTRNSHQGDFCRRHAEARVKEMRRLDALDKWEYER